MRISSKKWSKPVCLAILIVSISIGIVYAASPAPIQPGNTGNSAITTPERQKTLAPIILDENNLKNFKVSFQDLAPVKQGEILSLKMKKESGIIANKWSFNAIMAANPDLKNVSVILPGKVYKSFRIEPVDKNAFPETAKRFFIVKDDKTAKSLVAKAAFAAMLTAPTTGSSCPNIMGDPSLDNALQNESILGTGGSGKPKKDFALPLPNPQAGKKPKSDKESGKFALPMPPQK